MKRIRNHLPSRLGALIVGAIAGVSTTSGAFAQDRVSARTMQAVPQKLEALRLENAEQTNVGGINNPLEKLTPGLADMTGRQQVVVRLQTPSVGQMGQVSSGVQLQRKINIESEQDALVARLSAIAPDINVLARTQVVLNAVFLEVDAEHFPAMAADVAISRIAPVGHYELDLSDTVPYIGGTAVQDRGFDGEGIRVAVLDSGIDYTHADLGGSGDPDDYINNDGTFIEPGTFPTAKVVDGYDFLGNQWPFGPVLPDPDPLDDLALIQGAFAGHGTHVADIIAGQNGVAPGASLVGVKVCASLSSSCNGIALIQGMEFSVDPDGDGDTSDAVDIINMSLGANYGQPFDDDLSAAVDAATAVGTLTVSSAGNCSDQPYCTGTPSSAPTAISVAQTQVPSAVAAAMEVLDPADQRGSYAAVQYTWTPDLTGTIEGLVQYGDIGGTNLNGCAPFTGDLTGRIVAVDRGACFFSDKIRNIENAGGVLGIVMLIAPGGPFPGGFGGGPAINIPGFNIRQSDGDILRNGDAVVRFKPGVTISLAGSTVGSTARGPDMSSNSIKPEIGAPGASISADVATGTGRAPFGGTSGASPMVAGSAALLLDACNGRYDDDDDEGHGCSPLEIKAQLMNTGFRDVISDTTGGLAEITRIGGGEVRVDKALATKVIAYSPDDDQPSLGLGFMDVSKPTLIKRKVTVKNLSDDDVKLRVTPTFRFQDDQDSGAVSVSVRRAVNVDDEDSETFNINFHVFPDRLTGNFMNSGSQGDSAANLTAMEYDGYLTLSDRSGNSEIALPWHIIPRKAAQVKPQRTTIVPGGFPVPDTIGLVNQGAGAAQNDAYSLVAVSDEKPRGGKGQQAPMPDIRAVGVNTIPVPAGFCSANPSFLWLFAINTWDRQTHLVPVSHQVALDIDRDGVDDYIILNRDFTFNNVTDGRQLSWVFDLANGSAGAFFFAEHATNTGNTILTVCAEQLGLSRADFFRNVDISVFAQDFYYGGPGDLVDGITIAPLGERFFGIPNGDFANPDIPAGAAGTLDVIDFGALPGNSDELGVMLVTNGDRGTGNRGGATQDTEALLFLAPGVEPPAPLPPEGGGKPDDDDDDDDDD